MRAQSAFSHSSNRLAHKKFLEANCTSSLILRVQLAALTPDVCTMRKASDNEVAAHLSRQLAEARPREAIRCHCFCIALLSGKLSFWAFCNPGGAARLARLRATHHVGHDGLHGLVACELELLCSVSAAGQLLCRALEKALLRVRVVGENLESEQVAGMHRGVCN